MAEPERQPERGPGSESPVHGGIGEGFVGRRSEMETLLAGLDAVLANRRRLFLVGGEPGIGKTRLASEFAGHAVARGVRSLWGRSWEAGGAPAYWPWIQVVRELLRNADTAALTASVGSQAADLAQMIPELR